MSNSSSALDARNQAEKLSDVAQQALANAREAGADAADIMASTWREFEVKVADDEIITLTQATRRGIGLRTLVGNRLGFCTSSDLSPNGLKTAAERAVALAREAAGDDANTILQAPQQTPRSAPGDLEIYDPAIQTLSTEEKIKWAHELEQHARASDPRVRKFRDSGISTGDGCNVLANSNGLLIHENRTQIALWCTPIAEQDGDLQTEFWYDAKTHLADLEPISHIGRTAGERAARMLGAKPLATQRAPVLFEPAMAGSLASSLLGAITGEPVYKKASFLIDRIGDTIAAPSITMTDNPHLTRGLASTWVDGEGSPTTQKRVLENGVLRTYLLDTYTGTKLQQATTGNARRSYGALPHPGAFNFCIAAGETPVSDIIAQTKRGLLVTRGLGRGLNPVSGEYSRGVNGLWIEDGEIVGPVQEVTIAGDFLAMLRGIDAVGSDFAMRGSTGAPTLRMAEMTISGRDA